MTDKVMWTGYIDYDISQLIHKIRKIKGWSKSTAIEMAFRQLIEREKEKGTLQNVKLSAADSDNGAPFEEVRTRRGRIALRPKEDVYL